VPENDEKWGEKIVARVSSKSLAEITEHYQKLVNNVVLIESSEGSEKTTQEKHHG